MTGDELIDEGRRLARPARWLVPGEGPPVGAWGGLGAGGRRPIITIALERVPTGTWRLEAGPEGPRARRPGPGESVFPEGSVPLCASEHCSLPPIDVVLRRGSERVARWLRSLGWDPAWGFNGNFPEPAPVQRYEEEYQRSFPLYLEGWWCVVGGWPMRWPEDEADPDPDRFVLMTLAEAEPWYEAWLQDGVLSVRERTT